MVRIDVFFKKKIITIYLHPGAREGERRRAGLVLFTRDTGGAGAGGGGGLGRGPRGQRSSYPHTPVLPSLPSPRPVKILLKSHPRVEAAEGGTGGGNRDSFTSAL